MFISDRLVLLAAAACDPEQDKSLENGLTETGTSLFWPFRFALWSSYFDLSLYVDVDSAIR